MKKETPMISQYRQLREKLESDILLFFRLGDFYELFFEDAIEASKILEITLTKRQEIPMCGVPYQVANKYIARLIKAGKRVAIAEQTSPQQQGKLVKREIAQIISAGTTIDENLLSPSQPNHMLALYQEKGRIGIACIDHSTSHFSLLEVKEMAQVIDEIKKLSPTEILISEKQKEIFPHYSAIQFYDDYPFLPEYAEKTLCEHFKIQSLHGLGCQEVPIAMRAGGALIHYLTIKLQQACPHLQSLKIRENQKYLLIDASSQLNLNLVESPQTGEPTLLETLDKTKTAMGSRKLRQWILYPSQEKNTIIERHHMIEDFIKNPSCQQEIQTSLDEIRDLERLASKICKQTGNARDLKALGISLSHLPKIQKILKQLPENEQKKKISEKIHSFDNLVKKIERAIEKEPPISIKEGGIIRLGYDEKIDELKNASILAKEWLTQLQKTEAESTSIEKLKIRFNNIIGYFIEIPKSQIAKAPETYQRKQTMTNAERFITPELKEIEAKIFGAEERSKLLEYERFIELREWTSQHFQALMETANAIATLDILSCFTKLAQERNYVKPILKENNQDLKIIQGRHPVLEQHLITGNFIANNTEMKQESSQLILLTGPNMAGKSTYIRQTALIALMAHIGSYVPAKKAEMGMIDRLFCRVGSGDNLAKGQSTFMVEMNETALITNTATKNSLVILDEIGRGTATLDGLSLAWAIAEYLHNEISCRCLFATHYHELTTLEKNLKGFCNYHVAVHEKEEKILFLHQIQKGATDKSYGIQVARLAGIPKPILKRSEQILKNLEKETSSAKIAIQPELFIQK